VAITGIVVSGIFIDFTNQGEVDGVTITVDKKEHRFELPLVLTGGEWGAHGFGYYYVFPYQIFVPNDVSFKTQLHVVKPGIIVVSLF
jgi:hypothetical protein